MVSRTIIKTGSSHLAIARIVIAVIAGAIVASLFSGCAANQAISDLAESHDTSLVVSSEPSVSQVSHVQNVEPAGLVTLKPSDNLLELVEQTPGNVLVDFYADWCGPCKKQSKILKQLETTAARAGSLIVKVNVDEHQELASEFRVTSLPTLILIKDGLVTQTRKGLTAHQEIEEMLER